jgi:hypothetical protein
MKKTLVFALATVAAGLSVFSNVEAASAQLEVNLVIPLIREPVVHRRYYRESYRQPYYGHRNYRHGRVYRYDRDDRYDRGYSRQGNRYGVYRRYDDDSYRRGDDWHKH